MKETMVAKYWGMMPWEFRSLSPEHQAELVAVYAISKEIDGYYASESARKMDRVRNERDLKSKRPAPRRR